MSSVEVELCGGPADGTRLYVPWPMPEALSLPIMDKCGHTLCPVCDSPRPLFGEVRYRRVPDEERYIYASLNLLTIS